MRSLATGRPRTLILGIMLLAVACEGQRSAPPETVASRARVDELVEASLLAMGSRAALDGISAIELRGVQQDYVVAVAQDPVNPPIFTSVFTEQRDVRQGRALREVVGHLPMRPEPIERTWYLDDGLVPGEMLEDVRLAPGRLLLAAATAPERRLLPDTIVAGRTLHVVAWGDPELRLLVDAETLLPAGWTSVRSYPDDPVWAVWGDVRTRVAWSNWSAGSTGLRYPFTINVWHNGHRARTVSYTRINWRANFPRDSFADVSDLRRQFAALLDSSLGNGSPQISEHAGGIVKIGGIYDVTLVRQTDGVVVIEAPHSSEYSRSILEEVERRWPGAPVKAVVAASPLAWTHLAGVRTYAARGIPIYASPRGARTIRGMVAAPHRQAPDRLWGQTGTIDVREVADSTRIGNLVLHRAPQPGGEHGRATLIVAFDDVPLAYLGDLNIPERFEPNFWRQSLSEGLTALDAIGSDADTILSLHNPPESRDALQQRAGG